MPKVSFRMASAYREWVFGIQTNTARKIHRSDHTEGRLTTAPSGCCVRKGTVTGTRRASSTAAEPPRAHGPVSPARCCVKGGAPGRNRTCCLMLRRHALDSNDEKPSDQTRKQAIYVD